MFFLKNQVLFETLNKLTFPIASRVTKGRYSEHAMKGGYKGSFFINRTMYLESLTYSCKLSYFAFTHFKQYTAKYS